MTDEHTVYCPAEEGVNSKNCPSCGLTVDTDKWDKDRVAAGSRGGSAHYSCPTESCDGKAVVLW